MTFRIWKYGATFADEVETIVEDNWRQAAKDFMSSVPSLGSETLVLEDESGGQREVTVDCDDVSYSVHLESAGFIEDKPTLERPPVYRIIDVDQLDLEGPEGDDRVIAFGIAVHEVAKVMCDALNALDRNPGRVTRRCLVVDQTYKLKEFQP